MTQTKNRKCYICDEDGDSPFVTYLDGKFQSICQECAEGVTTGVENLAKAGIRKQLDENKQR